MGYDVQMFCASTYALALEVPLISEGTGPYVLRGQALKDIFFRLGKFCDTLLRFVVVRVYFGFLFLLF